MSVLPNKPLKMYFGQPVEEPMEQDGNHEKELPLPDIVLCSALSAGIYHGKRIRERRRHKATIQTKGREALEKDPEELMEPLVRSLENLLLDEKVCMDPNAQEEDEDDVDTSVSNGKRRRSISASETASKLSSLSSATIAANKVTKVTNGIDDTPEGVFNGIKQLFRNVFSN